MTKQLLLPSALLALGLLTCAQFAETPEKKYFDINWKPLPTADKAAYYKLFEHTGEKEYQVTTFNIAGQKLEGTIGMYGYQGPLMVSRKWWLNGQLKYEAHHYQGHRYEYDGAIDSYYPNGILQRHDVYQAGKLLSGACYTSQGRPEPYYPFYTIPTLPGGGDLSTKMLHVKRPNGRVRTGEMIRVGFYVAADGSVRNAALERSITPATDSAALRVLHELPRLSAAYIEGEPAQFSYSLAIRFEE